MTLEDIVQDKNEDYQRSIILVTDGPDISSNTPQIVVSNMLSNVLSGKDFSFFFVDIINSDSSNLKLKSDLTKSGKAQQFTSEPKALLDLIPQIVRNL